ncbi:hypothetical protein HK098_004826, partial [Nowakowskiella sp. JEL0407]
MSLNPTAPLIYSLDLQTDYSREYIPRAIYNDPIRELKLRKEGLYGMGNVVPDEDLLPLKRDFKYTHSANYQSYELNSIQNTNLQKPKEFSQSMDFDCIDDFVPDGRMVVMTEHSIEIINMAEPVPIYPISGKPKSIYSPLDSKVYFPSQHKELPPSFPSTTRYASGRNMMARCGGKGYFVPMSQTTPKETPPPQQSATGSYWSLFNTKPQTQQKPQETAEEIKKKLLRGSEVVTTKPFQCAVSSGVDKVNVDGAFHKISNVLKTEREISNSYTLRYPSTAKPEHIRIKKVVTETKIVEKKKIKTDITAPSTNSTPIPAATIKVSELSVASTKIENEVKADVLPEKLAISVDTKIKYSPTFNKRSQETPESAPIQVSVKISPIPKSAISLPPDDKRNDSPSYSYSTIPLPTLPTIGSTVSPQRTTAKFQESVSVSSTNSPSGSYKASPITDFRSTPKVFNNFSMSVTTASSSKSASPVKPNEEPEQPSQSEPQLLANSISTEITKSESQEEIKTSDSPEKPETATAIVPNKSSSSIPQSFEKKTLEDTPTSITSPQEKLAEHESPLRSPEKATSAFESTDYTDTGPTPEPKQPEPGLLKSQFLNAFDAQKLSQSMTSQDLASSDTKKSSGGKRSKWRLGRKKKDKKSVKTDEPEGDADQLSDYEIRRDSITSQADDHEEIDDDAKSITSVTSTRSTMSKMSKIGSKIKHTFKIKKSDDSEDTDVDKFYAKKKSGISSKKFQSNDSLANAESSGRVYNSTAVLNDSNDDVSVKSSKSVTKSFLSLKSLKSKDKSKKEEERLEEEKSQQLKELELIEAQRQKDEMERKRQEEDDLRRREFELERERLEKEKIEREIEERRQKEIELEQKKKMELEKQHQLEREERERKQKELEEMELQRKQKYMELQLAEQERQKQLQEAKRLKEERIKSEEEELRLQQQQKIKEERELRERLQSEQEEKLEAQKQILAKAELESRTKEIQMQQEAKELENKKKQEELQKQDLLEKKKREAEEKEKEKKELEVRVSSDEKENSRIEQEKNKRLAEILEKARIDLEKRERRKQEEKIKRDSETSRMSEKVIPVQATEAPTPVSPPHTESQESEAKAVQSVESSVTKPAVAISEKPGNITPSVEVHATPQKISSPTKSPGQKSSRSEEPISHVSSTNEHVEKTTETSQATQSPTKVTDEPQGKPVLKSASKIEIKAITPTKVSARPASVVENLGLHSFETKIESDVVKPSPIKPEITDSLKNQSQPIATPKLNSVKAATAAFTTQNASSLEKTPRPQSIVEPPQSSAPPSKDMSEKEDEEKKKSKSRLSMVTSTFLKKDCELKEKQLKTKGSSSNLVDDVDKKGAKDHDGEEKEKKHKFGFGKKDKDKSMVIEKQQEKAKESNVPKDPKEIDAALRGTITFKGPKCDIHVENFELYCVESGKGTPPRPYFPLELRRIVVAAAVKDEVTISACVPKDDGNSGSKFKEIPFQFSNSEKANLFAETLIDQVYGEFKNVVTKKAVLVLVDKYEGEKYAKLITNSMKPVWDAIGKPSIVKTVQFNEFSVANVLSQLDTKNISNILCTNPEFTSKLMQVIVRNQISNNPVNLQCEPHNIDAALAILRAPIGSGKNESLFISTFLPKKEESGKLAS